MFESVQPAPPDPILGLTEAFRQDSNSNKINLGVGVYQDASGKTPVLECVREAGRRVAQKQETKTYLPIPGTPEYGRHVRRLLFGREDDLVSSGLCATAHTPGGTGALRVAADFIHQNFPKANVWLSDPTWPNHPKVFAAAGVPTKTYPYFDAATNGLAFEQTLAAIQQVPVGDVVLLHGGCHNPTGIDPTLDQWRKLADVIHGRGLLPMVDFAYQGFADGIEEDAAGLQNLVRSGKELLVCSSFSKNFGLYRDRVGALSIVGTTREATAAVESQIKVCIRSNYSNPPSHGAELVTTVLDDPDLSAQWVMEVAQMRDRINGTRQQLVETLKAKGVPGDFSFITRQRGMFSFSGLTPEQVDTLRQKHSIYIVRSGRINVAGITPSNVERLCEAIAEVVRA